MKLEKLSNFVKRPGPLVFIVMDGIGDTDKIEGNAVKSALTPTLDKLKKTALYTRIKAHGTAVGLPDDTDMGNSEVGHNAFGAGRVFAQGAKLVNKSIESGSLFRGEVWNNLINNCKANNSKLHFLGLFSDGNVHSNISHLKAMIIKAAELGIKDICVHILLDGRDVGETSALEYVDPFEEFIKETNSKYNVNCRIASGGGRMKITMDRYEADWNMVKLGWDTHIHGNARKFRSAREAIETYRKEINGVIDQDLPAFVIVNDAGEPLGKVTDGDSFIFFNFRGDRAIEISKAFEMDDFDKFDRGKRPKVMYAGMMEYDGDAHIPKTYLVSPPAIDQTIGELFARNGIKQYAISETQKFGHVTYFWNGNRTGKFDDKLEEYVEITSDILPFEQRPWMKAAEITDAVIKAILSKEWDFIRLNFANGDMVGHTGVYQAAEIAVETVDLCLARILKAVDEVKGIAIITADHGNADEMYELDKKG
ncbi:MAG TPA: 2,3-bisphosphoglycerate-independent phosphoglycerate mutase, partial [bacterium]|nr:2,3-bisphosphoglycerate-independent phosphoglycerate mutase [bacterium]